MTGTMQKISEHLTETLRWMESYLDSDGICTYADNATGEVGIRMGRDGGITADMKVSEDDGVILWHPEGEVWHFERGPGVVQDMREWIETKLASGADEE